MRACNPAANASASDAEAQDSTKRICRQVEPADSCCTRPSQSPRLRARAAKTGTAAARSKLGSEPKATALHKIALSDLPPCAALCCAALLCHSRLASPTRDQSSPRKRASCMPPSLPPSSSSLSPPWLESN
ncbi:hypothetical protein L1887_56057 [Cichorium endivia]|nr:hypothetical protein L1887_56057 [Cichorium endivia]